jgi:tetratricopeptide (TPR) repeat protein
MPVSSCQPLDLTCEQCHTKHTVEVWLIVDAAERPDLWVACRDGLIHTAYCPNEHVVYLGAPLLLHDPARKLLLFSPPLNPTTPAEEQRMVRTLMQMLHNSVSASVAHENYLNRVKRVPRDELAEELAGLAGGAADGRQDDPEEDEFLNLFSRLSRPAGADELSRNIRLCEEALRRYGGQEHEDKRGWINAKLGTFLAACASGDPAENLERSIEARKAALTFYTRDRDPLEWARLQVNLGNVYTRRVRGNPAQNLTLAAEAYRNALTVFTREQHPDDWKRVRANLAAIGAEEAEDPPPGRLKSWLTRLARPGKKALPERAAGTGTGLVRPGPAARGERRAAEGEESYSFHGPIKFRRDGSGPSLMTQVNEAMVEGNMRRLVQLCNLMLQIVSRETHARQWAQLQHAKGYGLLNSPEGEPSANVEQAIEAFEAAAAVVTPEASPKEFAELQNRLGIAYAKRILGDARENRGKARRAFEAALRYADPDDRAKIQQNLSAASESPWWRADAQLIIGNAYLEGARAASDLERAIESYKAALKVHRLDTSPKTWAELQFNLGLAYATLAETASESSVGSALREANIEGAIEAYKEALKVRTRDEYPFDWACTLVNLGIACRMRVRGSLDENVEESRRTLEAALNLLTRKEHPREWAIAQYNLGVTYKDRLTGDRPENQDRAAAAFENALQVFTREGFPFEWANVQIGLGDVYRERVRGDDFDNNRRAVRAYEAALTAVSRDANPIEWARLHALLGISYGVLEYAEAPRESSRALAAYEAALAVLTPENSPKLWAEAQHNLGCFLVGWKGGDRADNIEQAIRAFEAVSAVRPRRNFKLQARLGHDPRQVIERARAWVSLQINLGVAYELRVRGARAQNLKRALAAFEAALQVCEVGFGTDMARYAAANLGGVQTELQNWDEAYAAFQTALRATEREFGFALTEERKQSMVEQNAWIHAKAVESCLRMKPARTAEAFLFAEDAHSRVFRYQLSELPLPPPRDVPDGLAALEQQLLRQMRALQGEIDRTGIGETRWRMVDEATATREQLRRLWNTLRHKHGAGDYVALRTDEALEWEEFRQWLNDAT